MNLVELKKEYLEKQKVEHEIFSKCLEEKNVKVKNKLWKEGKALDKELNDIRIEIEKELGFIWNREDWVTDIFSDCLQGEEEARENLLHKIENLPGVIVTDDKKGIKRVTVVSAWKEYHYTINAVHCCEVIGQKEEDGIFGKYMTDITRPVIQACLNADNLGSSNNSAWRGEYTYVNFKNWLKED